MTICSRSLLFLAVLLLAVPLRADVSLTPDDKGIVVKDNNIPVLTIDYPTLIGDKGVELYKPTSATTTEDSATVSYDKGATLVISVSLGNLTYSFSNVPPEVVSWHASSIIDFAYLKGGTWKIDDAPAKPFPADPPQDDPHFFHGSAKTFQLINPSGGSHTFHLPPYAYAEVQDNRKWNWDAFAWTVTVGFDRSNPNPGGDNYQMSVTATPAPAAPAPASP